MTGNDSRYNGLSLLRTLNDVPRVSATTRVDCICLLDAFNTSSDSTKLVITVLLIQTDATLKTTNSFSFSLAHLM